MARLAVLLLASAHALTVEEMQAIADAASAKCECAVQMAYKPSAAQTLAVSAGSDPVSRRPVRTTDTLLFGSATKPYSAALAMQLAAAGHIDLDAPAAPLIDAALAALGSNATFDALFPAAARRAVSVHQLLAMRSGIADFDVPDFDAALLADGLRPHALDEFLAAAAAQRPPCAPGRCVAYSSTNYILAGLAMLGSTGGDAPSALDQSDAVPPRLRHRDAFVDAGPLNRSALTIGGVTRGKSSSVTMWDQDATLLGWTCGNLAARASEVAAFFWDLLVARTVVSPRALAMMADVSPLSAGWAKGYLSYGTGLMLQQTSLNGTRPPVATEWGAYLGHGGETYGFLSESGLIPQLNATFSVVANTDFAPAFGPWAGGSFVLEFVACRLIAAAARGALGHDAPMRCLDGEQPPEVRAGSRLRRRRL